ncbi:MAG: hypothetical protein ACE5ID_04540 [Acidobacteriota bacterium]
MKRIAMLAVLAVLGGGAAFAWVGGLSWLDSLGLRGDEALLRSRVEAYWQARVEGEMEKQVPYIHPLQKSIPEPGMLITEKAKVLDLRLDGDEAYATVDMTVRLKHAILGNKEREVKLEDKWVRYQGEWYKDVHPVGLTNIIKEAEGKWKNPAEEAKQEKEDKGSEDLKRDESTEAP